MPLVSSYWLSKKTGKEAWVEPIIDLDKKTVDFSVKTGKGKPPNPPKAARGAKFLCSVCGELSPDQHIKSEAASGRMGAKMMAIVADGGKGRAYLAPNEDHITASVIEKPKDILTESLPYDPRNIWCVNYGLTEYRDLFTPRQLTALTTFSDLIGEAIIKAQTDALTAGLSNDGIGIDAGGKGAKAYSEAIGVYLACAVDKAADINASLASWVSAGEFVAHSFTRQALPMVWDFAEANILGSSSGCWDNCVDWVIKCLRFLKPLASGIVTQRSAEDICTDRSIVISTDPPYYDNIGYADLSDFFYVWLRRSLSKVYPELFSTMLVPKSEELIVTPYRFDGNAEKAKIFFEKGMSAAFSKMRSTANKEFPLTIYYAFKQSESKKQDDSTETVSIGWETILKAIMKAGFSITGTWPLRTERDVRMLAMDTNALASSIAIICRPRQEDALTTNRRAFIGELREALKIGLHDLQSGNIAPVDLAQASIGPGMAVYSKYVEVLEADGTPMSVRDALVLINQELDAYLTAQEGHMDTESRFCIAWFEQYGLTIGMSGDADTLARAKLAHVQELADDGVLESGHGITRLKRRDELPEKWDSTRSEIIWTMVQQLCRCLETKGLDATAGHMVKLSTVGTSNIENVKNLAYRAYIAAERKGWADEALAYNSLVTAWPDLIDRMNKQKDIQPEQLQMEV
jgi:putative DNA methylase